MNELTSKLISIILPVYNGEKYLSLSIESCLNQTYRNIELIIVNDCSTDATVTIANHYAKIDNRVTVINNLENKKLPASLNIGHFDAKGDFITWTSDDNYYENNALEELLKSLIEKEADVAYSNFFLIDSFGNRKREVRLLALENLIFGNVIGSCFLYKKDVFEKNKGYDETLFLVEDYDFWLCAIINNKFCKVNKFLYNYRSHDSSLTNQISSIGDRQILWRKNIDTMYFKFSKNFLDNDAVFFAELQTKILTHQKISFKWVTNNNFVIKKFHKKISSNFNFLNKKLIMRVFMKQMISLMVNGTKQKNKKLFCFFIFRKYFFYLDKNSLKTLIKYSFFK